MKKVVINSQLISYSEYLSGKEGQTLLFLHGWRVDGSIWNKTIELMRQAGIKNDIYAMDFSGFGGSPAPTRDFCLSDYCGVVEGFIEKLGLEKVIIIGHSFGGRVGIKLSATHPELINKLVLVDSAGLITEKNKKSAMKLGAKMLKPFFANKFMQPLRKKIYQAIGSEDYLATPQLQKTYINVTNEDLSLYLPQISAPTLIIWGAKDLDTPLGYAEIMKQKISNSQLIIYPEAGHFSFSDNQEEFVKNIKEFIHA
ncbi:MAG: alpha/beta hydrolase [Patescibacteria group bacterium]|jgi:pimeloyl-ACP methyl ester carboxylesterase